MTQKKKRPATPLTISKETFDILKKQDCKNIVDLIAVYMFYADTSNWQNNNQVWATTSFVSKGLKITEKRVREAKKVLISLGLIEDVKKYNGDKGTGNYIKVNFLLSRHNLRDLVEDPESCTDTPVSNGVRTDTIRNVGQIPSTSNKIPFTEFEMPFTDTAYLSGTDGTLNCSATLRNLPVKSEQLKKNVTDTASNISDLITFQPECSVSASSDFRPGNNVSGLVGPAFEVSGPNADMEERDLDYVTVSSFSAEKNKITTDEEIERLFAENC